MRCSESIKKRDGYKYLIDMQLSDSEIAILLKKGHTFSEILEGEWKQAHWSKENGTLQWKEKEWICKDKVFIKM